MPHRTFDVPEQEPDPDPITYALAGRELTCLPRPTLAQHMLVSGAVIYKRDMIPFLRGCLVDGDEAAFDEALSDKRYAMDMAIVEEAFWWVVDSYGERLGSPLAVRADPPPADPPPAEQAAEAAAAEPAVEG